MKFKTTIIRIAFCAMAVTNIIIILFYLRHLRNREEASSTSALTSAHCDCEALYSSSNCSNSNILPAKDVVLEVEESHLVQLMQGLGISVQRGPSDLPQKISPRTQFERFLLSSPPLQDDILRAPDELKSKVTVVNPKASYYIGDTVQFRVDLYDEHGCPRGSGGDEIRMRVISKPEQRTSIAAEVKDLGNGSYLGTTLLPWKGTASVQAYLTYPREYLREAVRQRFTLRSTNWLSGVFKSGSLQERTGCLLSLPIPGYDTACNLTDFNGGMSLFCGRPTGKGLNCKHLVDFTHEMRPNSLTTPAADQEMIKKILKNQSLRLIPNNISMSIVEDQGKQALATDLPPCRKRTPRSTWQFRAPRGWFDSRGVWHSFECSLPKQIDRLQVRRCLSNTNVYMIGDSNVRVWYNLLKKHLRCTKEIRPGVKDVWQMCEVASTGTSMKFNFHAQPTIIMHGDNNTPLPIALAEIRHQLRQHPGEGNNATGSRVVLLLHYFLHLAFYSPSEYWDRLRTTRRHLEDFLREFPEVEVVLRGPHAMFSSFFFKGDVFGSFYMQVLHSEFENLKDRVRFLDFWDMTTAAENKEFHPVDWVKKNILKVLLGHVCDDMI